LAFKHVFKDTYKQVFPVYDGEKSLAEACSDATLLLIKNMCDSKPAVANSGILIILKYIRNPTVSTSELIAALHLIRMSPALLRACKDRELLNKLMGILPAFYDVEDVEPRCNPSFMPNVNLN
jgi:hypothetical protein